MDPKELVLHARRAADKYSSKLFYTDYDEVYSYMLLTAAKSYNVFVENPERFSTEKKKKSYLKQGFYRAFLNLLKFQKRKKTSSPEFEDITQYQEYC